MTGGNERDCAPLRGNRMLLAQRALTHSMVVAAETCKIGQVKKTENTAAPRRLQGNTGMVLFGVYLILALATTGRSLYQIIRKFDEAPVAYTLSAVSAIVYVLITIGFFQQRGRGFALMCAALIFEFTGVVVVGLLSLLMPALFAHPSVWSHFGQGYGFAPLVLPIIGMVWLWKTERV